MQPFRMVRHVKRFPADDSGSATVEFVVLFPLVISIFLMGIEAGYYLLRDVMLDRATAVVARDIGLGKGDLTEYADVKAEICAEALIIPNCENMLQIEMWVVDMTTGATPMDPVTRCVDTASNASPAAYANFRAGAANQLVALRSCALSQPFFPTTALANDLAVDARGNYAITAKVGFVMEPTDGTIGSPAGTSGTNERPVDPSCQSDCNWEPPPPPTEPPVLVGQG